MSGYKEPFNITLRDGSTIDYDEGSYRGCKDWRSFLNEEEKEKYKTLGCFRWNWAEEAIDEEVAQFYLVAAAPGMDLNTFDVKNKVLPEVRKLFKTFFKESHRLFREFDDDRSIYTRSPFEQAMEFLTREPYYSFLLDARHSGDENGTNDENDDNNDGKQEYEEDSSSSWDGSTTASSMDLSLHHCPTCGSADQLFCHNDYNTDQFFAKNDDSAVIKESDFGGDLSNAPWDALLCLNCHQDETSARFERDNPGPYDEDGNFNPDPHDRLWSEPNKFETFTDIGGVPQRYMILMWDYTVSNGQKHGQWFSEQECEDEERMKLAIINFSSAIKQAFDNFISKSLGRLILKDIARFLKDSEGEGAEHGRQQEVGVDQDQAEAPRERAQKLETEGVQDLAEAPSEREKQQEDEVVKDRAAVPSEQEKQLEAENTRLRMELAEAKQKLLEAEVTSLRKELDEAKQQSAPAKRKRDDA